MLNRLSNFSNRAILGILIGAALVTSALSLIVNLTSSHANFAEWGEGWLQNFSTEMLGAFLTYILIERIIGGREKQREKDKAVQREKEKLEESIQQEKSRLIRQMGSSVNGEAIRAIEELRAKEWLDSGVLQNANLFLANLQEAYLINVDLRKTNFRLANLQKARLEFSVLKYANFEEAELQKAILYRANLLGANLEDAELQGTDLEEANLQAVNLKGARFDNATTLPDNSKWTPDTDLSRFTDPEHPNFWRSDNSLSPAYRGNTTSE